MNEQTTNVEKTIHASVSKVWHADTKRADLKNHSFSVDVGTIRRIGRPVRMKDELNSKKYEDVQ